MPPLDPSSRNQKHHAYAFAGVSGLLIIALHAMGLGVTDPSQVLTARSLAVTLPRIWPYILFAVGVLAQRRWARDLAAPAACLGLVAALALFPRYIFLDLGYTLSRAGASPAPVRHIWLIFRQALVQQAAFAALCGATLYALTRPSLIAQCRAEPRQPAWTDGLRFAALLPLSRQFFAASDALNTALYRFPDWADLRHLPPAASLGALLASPAMRALAPSGMAVLALAALVGLWKRRFWGWLTAAVQTLVLLFQATQNGFAKALAGFYAWQDKAPSAAPLLAAEAFCRNLPDLAVLVCVLACLLKSRRQYRH